MNTPSEQANSCTDSDSSVASHKSSSQIQSAVQAGADTVISPPYPEIRMTALGGGHGLYATLSALRRLTHSITAIVTVADDGGSSGRIRAELGIIPPGDLRMAIAALLPVGVKQTPYTHLLQHRFGGHGALAGHPVGNLLLSGLMEILDDPVAALTLLGRHFDIVGRVLPMSVIPLEIEADVVGLERNPQLTRVIRGQVSVATTMGKVQQVRIVPADAPACPQAIKAIQRSDFVFLGPGSWFTSVIPHLLVPEQLEALNNSRARKILILNLVPELGETGGFTAERHLQILLAHAPGLRIDDIIVDQRSLKSESEKEALEYTAQQMGADLHVMEVAEHFLETHDPVLLARAIEQLIVPHITSDFS